MLNGVDPIILFNLKKQIPGLSDLLSKIPVIADADGGNMIDLPIIPLYLSERLTGIFISSESKSIEIDTDVQTLSNGSSPQTQQRGLQNVVKIDMVASRNSIGISILSAMADLIFPKVTSKEYSITYLHGAVTIFGGMLHSFSIDQNAENDLYKITLELIRPSKKSGIVPTVGKSTGEIPTLEGG